MDKASVNMNTTRLQIIFFNKQVICQVRDQTWPDKETVWSDKKIPSERPKLRI